MTDGRPKAILRKSKVFQCAAHENTGGVNRLIESRFAIDQKNMYAALAQQTRGLQSRQSGANDDYIVSVHFACLKRQRSELESGLAMQETILVSDDEVSNEVAFVDQQRHALHICR